MTIDMGTLNRRPDEIMVLGMKCLADDLGYDDAFRFIDLIRASCPDYTLWRRKIYDDMTLDEINAMVMSDANDNPFE